MIYLTSFKRSRELPSEVVRYSAAVYQPKGYKMWEASCFKITDSDRKWIRPREFIDKKNPLISYRRALVNLYDGRVRKNKIEKFLDDCHGSDIALCCWCPYEKAAVRQLDQFGSFVCHLSVVGYWLKENHPEIPLWLDSDRLSMAVLTQKVL